MKRTIDKQSITEARPHLFKKFKSTVFLSYAAGFALMLIICILHEIYPFGPNHLLQVDASAEFAPRVVEMFDKIRNGGSLMYSWRGGLGTDFYFAFITAHLNPFLYLGIFTEARSITEVFTLMYILQIPFSALTFAYFAKEKFGEKGVITIAFSLMYAFCSYVTAYFWIYYYLTGFMLLPLLAVGLERLVKKRSIFMYAFFLGLGIISNYLIGLFLCCFAVLYYLNLVLNEESPKSLIKTTIVRFGISSLMAGGMALLVIVPTLTAIPNTTYSGGTISEIPLRIHFSILNFFTTFYSGMTPSVVQDSSSLPNVYSGLLSFMLLLLYFMNDKISKKERVLSFITLFIMYLFFTINILSFIIHGFHFSSGAPHRFAFVFVFFVLIMAFKCFINIDGIPRNRLRLALLAISVLSVSLFALYPVIRILRPGVFTREAIYANIFLLIVYGSFLYMCNTLNSTKELSGRRRIKKITYAKPKPFQKLVSKYGVLLVSSLVIIEMGTSTYQNFSLYKEAPQREIYVLELYDDIQAVKQYTSKEGFYRMEQIPNRVFSDGKLFGYNGISVFTITYEPVVQLLSDFGISSSTNKIEHRLGTPLLNSIFSVKYSLNRGSMQNHFPTFFEPLATSGIVTLAENPYAMPIGFMVSSDVLNWQANRKGSPFEFQNEFVRYTTPFDIDLFTNSIPIIEAELHLCELEDQGNNRFRYTIYEGIAPHESASASFTMILPEEGYYYFGVDGTGLSSFNIRWGDNNFNRGIMTNSGDLFDIGFVGEGTELNVTITMVNQLRRNDFLQLNEASAQGIGPLLSFFFDPDTQSAVSAAQTGSLGMWVVRLDEPAFASVFDFYSAEVIEVESYSDTSIRGSINVLDEGILFTSIPYDTRWQIYLNGEEVPSLKIGNALIGANIPRGMHSIEFSYEPVGVVASLFLSLLFFVLIIIFELYLRHQYKRSATAS